MSMIAFGAEFEMPLFEVTYLVRLSRQAADCLAHADNGDPHPRIEDSAKYRCLAYQEWINDEINAIVAMSRLCRPYGFTSITVTENGTTLKIGDRDVSVPYE